jgi:hypothetical protein
MGLEGSFADVLAMDGGLSFLMFLDFFPELIKMTAWVILVHYWWEVMGSARTLQVPKVGRPDCVSNMWIRVYSISAVIWLIGLVFVGVSYWENWEYTDIALVEANYLFSLSVCITVVALYCICSFVNNNAEILLKKAQMNTSQTRTGKFIAVLQLRITWATSITASVILIYFSMLFGVAHARNQDHPWLVDVWFSLFCVDLLAINVVFYLLVPRDVAHRLPRLGSRSNTSFSRSATHNGPHAISLGTRTSSSIMRINSTSSAISSKSSTMLENCVDSSADATVPV